MPTSDTGRIPIPIRDGITAKDGRALGPSCIMRGVRAPPLEAQLGTGHHYPVLGDTREFVMNANTEVKPPRIHSSESILVHLQERAMALATVT